MKYALATAAVVFLILLVFVLNAVVPLFVDRVTNLLP